MSGNSGSRIDKDQSISARGGGHRVPQALYTPGSGPLKKTGRQCDDYEPEMDQQQERSKPPSVQDRLRPASHQNIANPPLKNHPGSLQSQEALVQKLHQVQLNHQLNSEQQQPMMSNHFGRKNKKPEQPLYVPKKVQESIAADQDVVVNR